MCFNSFVYRKKIGFTLDFCQKLSFVIPESGKISPEQTFEHLFARMNQGNFVFYSGFSAVLIFL